MGTRRGLKRSDGVEGRKDSYPNFKEGYLRNSLFLRTFLIMVVLNSLLMVTGRWGQGAESQEKGAPEIQVTPGSYDFGKVSSRLVSHTFWIENTGKSDLLIYHSSTSCGCTTAAVDKATLSPGEKTRMVVNIDTQFHRHNSPPNSPPRKGPVPVRRTIYIRSNDPLTPEKTVLVTAILMNEEGGGS